MGTMAWCRGAGRCPIAEIPWRPGLPGNGSGGCAAAPAGACAGDVALAVAAGGCGPQETVRGGRWCHGVDN